MLIGLAISCSTSRRSEPLPSSLCHAPFLFLHAVIVKYFGVLAEIPALLDHEKFVNFLDPCDEPTSWLMALISKMRSNLTVSFTLCLLWSMSLFMWTLR